MYEEHNRTTRVIIRDEMTQDGVSITIVRKIDYQTQMVLHVDEQGRNQWKMVEIPNFEIHDPTMYLEGDCARALLDALLRHYQGASDMHTLRADFLHERGRVDKMIDTVSSLASRPHVVEIPELTENHVRRDSA